MDDEQIKADDDRESSSESDNQQKETNQEDDEDSFDEMVFDNLSEHSDHKSKDKQKLRKKSTIRGGTMRATQKFTRATTMRTTEILSKESFKIVKKLGKGAYGSVYLVKKKSDKYSDKLYAMKELEK